MIVMSDEWITQSTQILKTMARYAQKGEKDRLETITAILYTLNAVDRSIHGWLLWVQNLRFMTEFSTEELQQMEQGLSQIVRDFIEYDIDLTKRHEAKLPRIRFRVRQRQPTDDTHSLVA